MKQHPRIEVVYDHARLLTRLTGELYVVDHIVPRSKGGVHHPRNLRVITNRENVAKGNRPAQDARPFDPVSPRPTVAAAMKVARKRFAKYGVSPPGDYVVVAAAPSPAARSIFD